MRFVPFKPAVTAVLVAALMAGCSAPRSAGPPPSPSGDGGSGVQPPPPVAEAAWVDATDSPFAVRGVVEGFYGQPWSTDERLAAFDFMAKVGLNTYVYAPKDDVYQRQEWRKPYPEANLQNIQTLLTRAADDGVDFVYSISPGLDVTYSSPADRDALAAKVDQLRGIGVDTFMLSLDDVPEHLSPADAAVYGTDYAHAQADLANWLLATERKKDATFRLWMTPSHYFGTKPDPYLTSLGAHLDPDVPLVWTGSWVLAGTISAGDVEDFRAIVKHQVIIWDNYPVNDYTVVTKKRPALILGPLRGRAPDLAAHVSGYILNPMIQEEASWLPLYTAAEYLARPETYDPETAWRDAAAHLTKDGASAEILLDFAAYAQSSIVQPDEAPDLARAIADYWNGAAGGSQALWQCFTAMRDLPDELPGAVSPGLLAEVVPWLGALRDKGSAGLLGLEVAEAVDRKDKATVAADLPALRRSLSDIRVEDTRAYIAGGYVEDFLSKVIARAVAFGS